ncbi:MAG: alpha/beta hydrolase [Candidatus Beckwithbacteria bacterium]|nr:alpha/beta hydrolase [Patescibacteria group bacterium]
MKNVLILHGTEGNSQENWFPWLANELKKKNHKVWVPDLPQPDHPNTKRYRKFIFDSNWEFNQDSILIGHSSTPLVICNLLQNLPKDVQVNTCIFIGAFYQDHGWTTIDNSELFIEPYDWKKIKTKAKKFIIIHSDNDPYCPLGDAKWLAKTLDGELIIKKGQKHFSTGTMGDKYKQFPELLELI